MAAVKLWLLLGVALVLAGCAPGAGGENRAALALPLHGHFCGPDTPRLQTRDMTEWVRQANLIQPIDQVDAACKSHDICYAELGFGNTKCDLAFEATISQVSISAKSPGDEEACRVLVRFMREALYASYSTGRRDFLLPSLQGLDRGVIGMPRLFDYPFRLGALAVQGAGVGVGTLSIDRYTPCTR